MILTETAAMVAVLVTVRVQTRAFMGPVLLEKSPPRVAGVGVLQAVAPAADVVNPAGHARQAELPVLGWYKPAAHAWQEEEP